MFSATGLVAAFAVLALSVNVVNTTDTSPPGAGNGTEYTVAADGNGDFSTIAEAVAAAVDGDTILVQPGTYTEAIIIDKDITLAGDGPVEEIVIIAPESGPVFLGERSDEGPVVMPVPPADAQDRESWIPFALLLVASDSTIRSLTFQGELSQIHVYGGRPILEDLAMIGTGVAFSGGMAAESAVGDSINVTADALVTIRGSLFDGGGPIAVNDGAGALIQDNVLIDGPHIFYSLSAGTGTAIRGNTIRGTIDRAIGLFAPTTMIIENNEILDAGGDGISLGFFPESAAGIDPTIRSNSIIAASVGIDVASDAKPLIRSNIVSDTSMGINVEPDANPTIVDNILTGNRTAIRLTSSDAVLRGNELVGNTGGIIASGGSATIDSNSITGGSTGIVVSGKTTTPTLTHNTVCDNKKNVVVAAGAPMPDIDASNEICKDGPVS